MLDRSVRSYLGQKIPCDFKVVVNIYGTRTNIGQSATRQNTPEAGLLPVQSFINGFISAYSEYEFIDVGTATGLGRMSAKFKGKHISPTSVVLITKAGPAKLEMFTQIPQCRQIFFAACNKKDHLEALSTFEIHEGPHHACARTQIYTRSRNTRTSNHGFPTCIQLYRVHFECQQHVFQVNKFNATRDCATLLQANEKCYQRTRWKAGQPIRVIKRNRKDRKALTKHTCSVVFKLEYFHATWQSWHPCPTQCGWSKSRHRPTTKIGPSYLDIL